MADQMVAVCECVLARVEVIIITIIIVAALRLLFFFVFFCVTHIMIQVLVAMLQRFRSILQSSLIDMSA